MEAAIQEDEVKTTEGCDVENVIELTDDLAVEEDTPEEDNRTPQEIMDERLENSLLQSLKVFFCYEDLFFYKIFRF